MNDLIASNKRRTVALLVGFVAFVVLVGMAIGALVGNGTTGTIVATVIAAVFAFLASDDASFVSGQAIAVDGGFTAGHRFGFSELMGLG